MKRTRVLWMLYAATFLVLTLVAPADAEVTLRLSRPSYEPGEIVSFTLTNDTQWTIHMFHWPAWAIFDNEQLPVAPCGIVPIEWELYRGATDYGEWNQKGCFDEQQVPLGWYRLEFAYFSDCCPGQWFVVSRVFEIGPVPVEATSWGQVKAIFRE